VAKAAMKQERARDRTVDNSADSDDLSAEMDLRPRSLEEFIGQQTLKGHLKLLIEAARKRGDAACDHMLFCGPPGLGKTSMASIVAAELGVGFRVTSGPALERPGDLAAILSNLDRGDVLFVDEIHRLPRPVEELLYPALEDFKIDIVIGKGPAARSVRLDLPRFTLIGATTRPGLITGPLRDRFGLISRFEYYSAEELALIVMRSASLFGLKIEREAALEIGARSRGTPRIANRILRRVRDFIEIEGAAEVTTELAHRALEVFEIDKEGLDRTDREILRAIVERFGGGPVGLQTLAAVVGEDPETLEEVYEPYLIKRGFMHKTPKGRVATPHAYQHLGISAPPEAEVLTLFDT
jgi:Holliday junction DNA helicase RuvB